MTDLEWLERISADDVTATARTRTVIDIGAFRLLLDPNDAFPGVNWATPLRTDPSAAELAALCEAFQAQGRQPRLEFVGECWPGLPQALERAGFQSEGTAQELMLSTPESLRAHAAHGVTVQLLGPEDPDALFWAYLETQGQGFGYSSDPPTLGQVAGWRGQVRAGRRAALALLEARAVGVGTTLGNQLAELQGVATLPSARRRGVASTLSSALVRDALERGAQGVWLSVEDAAARACYQGIGFRPLGSRLNYHKAAEVA